MRESGKFTLLFACILLLAGVHPLYSQSKTEEAKERLSGRSSGTGSALVEFLSIYIEFMPQFFYFTPREQNEPVLGYNATPYNPSDGNRFGIRSFGDDSQFGLFETQMTLDMPLTSKAMEMRNVDFRWHLRYWAFRGGYSYMKESIAPYGIHQFNIDLERKFRFMPQSDGGFFLGYRQFQLSGDRFQGFDMGVDMTFFLFNPVSLQYIYNVTLLRHGESHQHQIMGHVHQGRFRFTLGYRHLNIIGVPFSGMTAGIGFGL